MSGIEAAIMAGAGVTLWQLMKLNDTLADCLTALKKCSEEIRLDLYNIRNEIRTK
jgi:hypothetical protein